MRVQTFTRFGQEKVADKFDPNSADADGFQLPPPLVQSNEFGGMQQLSTPGVEIGCTYLQSICAPDL